MKNLIALLALTALFTGCEKLEGQLNVIDDIQLVSSKGEKRAIRIGTYTADVSVNTSKKITLRLNNDGDEKYIFNVPNGSIPSNGAFSYTSRALGQPVDLAGVVATKASDSGRRQGTEFCQYQTPVQVCAPVPNGGVVCTIKYQTVNGIKRIQYVDRTTTRDLTMKISRAGTSTESADFAGSATWVEKVILSQSACM